MRYTSTALGFRREYPITDHLGSIRVVLTPDERQSIVSRSDFEPFGAPLSNGRERLSFIGKEQDNESSLGDYGVRKYDPTLGRFMSVDALSDLMPGTSPFHYCFNNPLILRDPSGLVPGDIGSDGIPRFTTGEVVVYGDRDNGSEDVIRDRKLEWMAKRAAAAVADMAPRAQVGGEGATLADVANKVYDATQFTVSAVGTYYDTKGNALHNEVYWRGKTTGRFYTTGRFGTTNYLKMRGGYANSYKAVGNGLKTAKSLGNKLGVAGLAMTVVDLLYGDGPTTSNKLDLVFGCAACIPGFGWAISGSYFIVNTGIQLYTGKTIGEHLDD